jgi:iron(II)-dependent oxidoreductase
MYCRICDIEYPKTLRYCKWCGGALADKESIGSQHCPACSTTVNREWLFCNECGVDLASISAQPRDLTCPSCSAAVRKGWMFCRQCGEQIVTERAEGRCDVCGGGLRAGWQYCKQCGAAGTGKGAAIGGRPSDSARFATVVGIPAVGTEVDEDEPFSGLGSGELPSVDAMIDSDRKNRPSQPRRVTGAPQPGETRNITFGKTTGPIHSKDLPTNQPPPVNASASEGDSLRTVAMEAPAELRKKPQPPTPQPQTPGYQVPSAFSNQPTVAIPAVPPTPEPPAAKSGFQVPSAFSNQPTVAIPAVPGGPDDERAPTAGDAGSYQVPSAFSSQPTVAIPAVPEPVEPKSGFQVPGAFSNQPTVAIPSLPDPEAPAESERVGVQAPAGFSPLPTVAIPALPDTGDEVTPGHATPSGFSANPTLAFPSVSDALEAKADPYSTFDPSAPEPPPSPSQGLATTIMAAPPLQPQAETAVISGLPTDQVSAAVTQGNQIGYEPSPPAYAGTASVEPAEVKTTQVEKAKIAAASGGSSALKWVAIAVVTVAILAALSAVGVFLWSRNRTTEPGPIAQPTAPTTAPTPTTQPTPAPPTAPEIPPDMVAVAGGNFEIGNASSDADDYSKPVHSVTVKPFVIDKTEVTNAQYKEFVDKTSHRTPSHWVNGTFPEGAAQLPVVNVSWQDAADYAKWAGKRLPTEIEWEVAARGTDGRLYPWGSNWDTSAANVDQKNGALKAVGSYPAGVSPCGASDMIGNVWEWTSSDYEPYPGSSVAWPKDDAGKERRPIKIIRGGAFSTGSKVNATWRGFYEPDKPGDRLGFRCVKDAS